MGKALEVVNRLYDVTKGDVEAEAAVRELKDLVTEDMSFSGPLMEVRGAEQYLAVNKQFLPFHKETRMIKQFEDGEHVCSIYDFVVRTPAGEELTIPMVDWIRISRGRVAEQRIYYDPREFAKAFGL